MTAKTFKLNTTALMAKAVAELQRKKQWGGHDRKDTVGASEIAGCARQVWYDKNETPWDAGFEQDFGALERGHAVERWAVERMQQELRDSNCGVSLIWATDEGQKTLVSGAQSATPDGMFVADVGLIQIWDAEIGNYVEVPCVYNEIKSIDPRPFEALNKAKHRHIMQCQQGMDLVRRLTNYAVEYAVITYINASFLSQQKPYVVKYDPKLATSLKTRAERIMYDHSADALPLPEGRAKGGTDCDYCPFYERCLTHDCGRIPTDEKPVSPKFSDKMLDLVKERDAANEQSKLFEKMRKELDQTIFEQLEAAGTKKIKTDWGSVSVSKGYPPPSLDKTKFTERGLDPADFTKEGQPYPRLTIRLK